MTKFTKILLSTSLMFSTLLVAADNTALKKIIEKVPMIKNINAEVTDVQAHKGLYQFKAQVRGPRPGILEGFITKDFKNIVMGKGFNANTGEQLSIPIKMNLKALRDVAAYSLGNGDEEYFLFTDPECPYCMRLEQRLTSIKKNVKLYVILYPLSFHKNAKSMSRYILNQKDNAAKAQAMKEIAHKDTKYLKAQYSTMEYNILNDKIEKALKVANQIGINATPSILSAKGERVSDAALRN